MSMPILPSIPPRLRLADTASEPSAKTGPDLASGASSAAIPRMDAATLSDSAALQMGQTLAAKGPPFDLETVARIKEAIAEGRYPIDTKAISESLFSGLSDMYL